MEKILIFILQLFIQSVMYTVASVSTSQLILKKKSTKKQIFLHFTVLTVASLIAAFLRSKVKPLNMFIALIALFLVNIVVQKANWKKSLLITMIAFLELAVAELLTAFTGLIIWKKSIKSLASSFEIFYLILIQCMLVCAISHTLSLVVNKKKVSGEFLERLNFKQVSTFAITLMLYFLPTMILLILGNYKYPPILFLINAVQFAIVCIFLFSYLKKTIENEKTQSDLFTSELHNKTLIGMVDGVRTLKHDYNIIMQALNGYVSTKQYDKLQEHINSVLKECNVVNNLSVIDPKLFNEPAIYGIVGSKFFLATEADITFDFDVTSDIATIPFPMPELSRILGILLDNAIEATKKATKQYIRLEIKFDNRKNADIIKVINTYDANITININDIYKKGYSTKEVKSGIGLWEVKKLIKKNPNSQIFAYVNEDEHQFIQNIIIER